jgi:hypothetical protein
MKKTSTLANQIRQHASRNFVQPARHRGDHVVKVVVGDVHRDMKLRERIPAVCSALKSQLFLRENSLTLEQQEGPPSGQSPKVIFTYRLDDARQIAEHTGPDSTEPRFTELRGLAKELFKSLGGGENFVRMERANFETLKGRK